MIWTLGIVAFAVVIAVTIAVHEAGHYYTAKALGFRVPQFYVGFGPRILKFTRNETEFGVRLLPLGGFIQIQDPDLDDEPEVDHSRTDVSRKELRKLQEEKEFKSSMLPHVDPWKRILIFLAGPAVNIVIGLVVLVGIFWATPVHQPTTTVDEASQCGEEVCGAHEAGIEPGDEIVAVNGTEYDDVHAISATLENSSSADITVLREGQEVVFEDVSLVDGKMGVFFNVDHIDRDFGDAVVATTSLVTTNLQALAELPSRISETATIIGGNERGDDTMVSVYSISMMYGDVADSDMFWLDKFRQLVYFTGALNLGLGLINLLPLMPLDGGRIIIAVMDSLRKAFAKIRKIDYHPTRMSVVMSLSTVTLSIVVATMGVVILADLISPVRLE